MAQNGVKISDSDQLNGDCLRKDKEDKTNYVNGKVNGTQHQLRRYNELIFH